VNKEVQKQIKNLIVKLAVKQLKAVVIQKLPWFSGVLINPFLGLILGWVLHKVLDHTILGLYLIYIRLDVAGDVSRVNKVLAEIKERETPLTEEEIEKLDKDLAEAGRDLIRFN